MHITAQTQPRNLVVIGTSAGKIKLVDLAKNRVTWTKDFGGNSVIFDVEWNSDNILAVGGTGNHLFLLKYEPKALKFNELAKVSTSSSIRSLHFNPNSKHQLAFGLFNGSVIIQNVAKNETLSVLRNSDARVLCLKWHP